MKDDGFTLIEALVALSIISITIVSLLKVHGRNIEMEGRGRDITIASIIAKEKLGRLWIGDNTLPTKVTSKGEDERYPGFYTETKITDTQIEEVKEVTVRVYTIVGKGEEKEQILLSTYIANQK